MKEIKLKSKWLSACIENLLGKEILMDFDLQRIKYLYLCSCYGECEISFETPPNRVIHPNSGDQWLYCCDWDVKSKDTIEDIIYIEKSDYNNTISYRLDLCDNEPDLEESLIKEVTNKTIEFEKSITSISSDSMKYVLEENECLIYYEDLCYFTSLEELRLPVCDDIYSLEFLKNMYNLRILEMSEVTPKNDTGFEYLLNLQQLCIWL
jgi:hypothetical protein